MASSPKPPPERNYAQEYATNLQTQTQFAPQLYQSEAEFQPKYGELERQMYNETVMGKPGGAPGMLEMYKTVMPEFQKADTEASMMQRRSDIESVEELGQRAVAAFKAANPEQQALMGELNRQAMSELSAGASLDPEMRREVQQGVRAGQSARGIGMSMTDAATEAFAVGSRADQMRRQRQGFGTQVAALNAAQQADPYQVILGRSATPAMAGQMLGQAGQMAPIQGPQLFNPESQYAQDIWQTNYNTQWSANVMKSQAKNQLINTGIQAAGQAIGGMTSM